METNFYRTSGRHIPGLGNLHNQSYENLQSNKMLHIIMTVVGQWPSNVATVQKQRKKERPTSLIQLNSFIYVLANSK
jgi:hypothetical protein